MIWTYNVYHVGHGFTDRCLQPIQRTYPKITVLARIELASLDRQSSGTAISPKDQKIWLFDIEEV